MYKLELGMHKHAHKECLPPALETSKTADMEKGDIPITQIDGEVEVVGEDRLQPMTRAQGTRVHVYPPHWLLCHLGLC